MYICTCLNYVYFTNIGPYLIVVTKKECLGSINGHLVYEVKGTELIPFSKTNIHLSESQVCVLSVDECIEHVYMSLVMSFCKCCVSLLSV